MYIPAKPAPTTTTSNLASPGLLPGLGCKAGIVVSLIRILDLRTSIQPAGPKRKGQIAVPAGIALPGPGGHDKMAQQRVQKNERARQGVKRNHEIADLRHAWNRVSPARL